MKREALEANLLLPRHGLVDMTFGNVSVLDRERRVFAIKPSGMDYGLLTEEDMVVLDLEGNRVEGTRNPSSDAPTHRRLFQAFPEIGSVVHTHSRKATAFAQAGRPIPCLGTTHADYFPGEVPVTRPLTAQEVAGDYEWETGNVIVERFARLDPNSMRAVLVQGHGVFVWGRCGREAVELALALEIVADLAFHTLLLNPQASSLDATLLDRHFQRKHGVSAYYGQPES